MKNGSTLGVAMIGLAYAMPTPAQVTLESGQGLAGSLYKAVFRIAQTCGDSPINAFVVAIPEGVSAARPMPKAGWQLDLWRDGNGRPTRIRWSGGTLPGWQHDEFVIAARLPDQPGTIFWKVSPICDHGRIDWDGESATDEARGPSPTVPLTVVPNPPVAPPP